MTPKPHSSVAKIGNALDVGIGPHSDFPMEEMWQEAHRALAGLEEQFEMLRDLVTRLVNYEQDTNAWCDIYDVLHERYSSESNPASEPKENA